MTTPATRFSSLAAAALLTIGAACVSIPARAVEGASNCNQRAELLRALADKFQEQPVAVGLTSDGAAVVEILSSPGGSTWTLLYSLPNGVSCLMATGEEWQAVKHIASLETPI